MGTSGNLLIKKKPTKTLLPNKTTDSDFVKSDCCRWGIACADRAFPEHESTASVLVPGLALLYLLKGENIKSLLYTLLGKVPLQLSYL